MLRTLLRWLATLFLMAVWCLPLEAQEKEAEKEPRTPVPEFTVAFLVTALVLAVVCMPSRKD
jgi:hypothetical protein